MRLTSRPQLADRISFGLASSMRVASSRACEAAEHHGMDRADARAGEHGDDRLRHHRHIEDDAVALGHADVAQHGGEHLRLGQQAVIGDGALFAGERGIVDDRRLLAAPGIDMAVDGVEAGVADAVGKPAAVDAGLWIEDGAGRLDPVDLGRRLAPKALRVALPARVDLVVAARPGVHGVLQLFPSSLRRSRSGPRRATARTPRPSSLRGSLRSHLRMTDHGLFASRWPATLIATARVR